MEYETIPWRTAAVLWQVRFGDAWVPYADIKEDDTAAQLCRALTFKLDRRSDGRKTHYRLDAYAIGLG